MSYIADQNQKRILALLEREDVPVHNSTPCSELEDGAIYLDEEEALHIQVCEDGMLCLAHWSEEKHTLRILRSTPSVDQMVGAAKKEVTR